MLESRPKNILFMHDQGKNNLKIAHFIHRHMRVTTLEDASQFVEIKVKTFEQILVNK